MFTHKYLHTRLGQIKHWAGERSSRRERPSLFLRRQKRRTLKNISVLFVWLFPLPFLLFQFLSRLLFLNDAVVRRGESLSRIILTAGTFQHLYS